MSQPTPSATSASPPAPHGHGQGSPSPQGSEASGGISAAQMSLVLDVSRMLAVTADLDLLLRRIPRAVTALLNCERASIFLHAPAKQELWTKVALGREEIRMPIGTGIVGHVFQSNTAIH